LGVAAITVLYCKSFAPTAPTKAAEVIKMASFDDRGYELPVVPQRGFVVEIAQFSRNSVSLRQSRLYVAEENLVPCEMMLVNGLYGICQCYSFQYEPL
jgi:hypothetical protein